MISKYRPVCPIIAITRRVETARKLRLWNGVFPYYHTEARPVQDSVTGEGWIADVDYRIKKAIAFGVEKGWLKKGGNLVCVTGWKGGSGNTNTVRIIRDE